MRDGVLADCAKCPVALALGRALAAAGVVLPGLVVTFFRVCLPTPEVGPGHLATLATLPRAAAEWIDRFDSERRDLLVLMKPLHPFYLDLVLPVEAVAAV